MGEGLSLGEEGGTLRQATGAERHLGGAVGFFVLTECLRGGERPRTAWFLARVAEWGQRAVLV